MVEAGESVGVWGGGDVEELANQLVKVTYGADLSCVVIIDGDAEDFFGADDEFYYVQTQRGILTEFGFELRSNVPHLRIEIWGTRICG